MAKKAWEVQQKSQQIEKEKKQFQSLSESGSVFGNEI